MTDETKLVEQARTHSPAALAQLYDRYAPKMYAYFYRRVNDAALAEDLTGELFVRVVQAIQNKQAWRISFRAWMYRIAHNLVVDHYRRKPVTPVVSLEKVETWLVSNEGNPHEATAKSMDRERLYAAIHRLTPEQQETLALRFGEGLTARETAEILHKTTGAVEALQRRALAALRRILNG